MKHQRIGFFCESCLPFYGKSLEERPLGGTETGIIYLANELSLRGYEVEVFTNYYDSESESPVSNKPTYRPLQSIHSCKTFDALILVKDYRPARFRLPAKKVFLLTGDGPEQYANFGIGDHRMIAALDGIFCVSQWQADVLSKESGYPRNKMFFIGNGVHLQNFSGTEERFHNRLFYASSPNRGLHLAFIAFQLLQKLQPQVELHVYGGFDVYDDKQKFAGPLVNQFEILKNKMSQNKSIVFHGNCVQKQLAREMMKASILFYPNQFVETSCIVALEAQAAGCAVLASHSGGLPETVGERGILISEPVGSNEYFIKFAETAHTLLSNQEMLKTLSSRGRSYMFQHGGWDKVTGRFTDIIHSITN